MIHLDLVVYFVGVVVIIVAVVVDFYTLACDFVAVVGMNVTVC